MSKQNKYMDKNQNDLRIESLETINILKDNIKKNIKDLELMKNEGLEGGRFLDQKLMILRDELIQELDKVLEQVREDFRMECKKHKKMGKWLMHQQIKQNIVNLNKLENLQHQIQTNQQIDIDYRTINKIQREYDQDQETMQNLLDKNMDIKINEDMIENYKLAVSNTILVSRRNDEISYDYNYNCNYCQECDDDTCKQKSRTKKKNRSPSLKIQINEKQIAAPTQSIKPVIIQQQEPYSYIVQQKPSYIVQQPSTTYIQNPSIISSSRIINPVYTTTPYQNPLYTTITHPNSSYIYKQ